jgi:hypothetical protein
MERRALILFILAASAHSAQPEPGFTVTHLADSVSLLQGYECNIAVSAGTDGTIVVDTCVADVAESSIAAVQRMSNQPDPFRHQHPRARRPFGADAEFQKTCTVIAHDNVRNEWRRATT